MKLKIKNSNWSAGMPVVMMNRRVAEKIGVHAGDRITIKLPHNSKKQISSVVDIVESKVPVGYLEISTEVLGNLKLRDGQIVDVEFRAPPESVSYIKEKLSGKKLNKKEIKEIIQDVVSNTLSEPEIAVFVSAMYKNGMVFKETIGLIEAILDSGKTLGLKNKFIVDKHCIGGIAGNRTTPIVVSICAANGLVMPKTSSRAITSAAGTADCIEALSPVEFSMKDLKKIVNKVGGCLAWGGAVGMVPADSKIIKVEKMLKLDPRAQLLASIMSKKIAANAKYLLIDIPYGKGAKVSKSQGKILKNQFEKLGKYFNILTRVVLTKTNEPIGNGVGPVLEMIDVMNVLNPNKKGPKDLEKKSIYLAGEILEMTGKIKKGDGKKLAEKTLLSGDAWKKFSEIIVAQGGKIKELKPAKFSKEIYSIKNGKIKHIDNKKVNYLARISGCPLDKKAGVYLEKHLGESIKKGEKIITIYAESEPRLKEAIEYFNENSPIEIGNNFLK